MIIVFRQQALHETTDQAANGRHGFPPIAAAQTAPAIRTGRHNAALRLFLIHEQAEPQQADTGAERRAAQLIGHPAQVFRLGHMNRHFQNCRGDRLNARQLRAATGQYRARRQHAIMHAVLLQLVTNQFEQLFDARLDNVGEIGTADLAERFFAERLDDELFTGFKRPWISMAVTAGPPCKSAGLQHNTSPTRAWSITRWPLFTSLASS